MKLKAVTAIIRNSLTAQNVCARVRMSPGGGSLQVIAPVYGHVWATSDLRTIANIAIVNNLTHVRGTAIDPANMVQLTHATQFEFYL